MDEVLSRHVSGIASEQLACFPGIVIEGARQVGKSTLAQQIADRDAVMVSLDIESARSAAESDPHGFVNQAEGRQLVIDEIQRLPSLTLAIKASIDADRRPGRFILTGSASLLRVRGLADSLAGRVGRLTLHSLSQGEIKQRRDDLVSIIAEEPGALLAARCDLGRSGYAQMIAVGGYPEAQHLSPRIRGSWIDSYLEGVIRRDLLELRRQVSPDRAMALLRALAGRQSAELVKAKLAAEASIPEGTITGYIDLLHSVGLTLTIPPWTANISKRQTGRSKVLIVDSGVALRLIRLTDAQLGSIEYGEILGATLEGFVYSELLRQRTWSSRDFDVYHYRDRDGDEVGVVIELYDGTVIGIEVKASTSFSGKQFAGLLRMRDRLGDRFRAGIVLNTGSSGYRYSDKLWGAPISALWSLQDA